MKYMWKYYKTKTPKNSTGFYIASNDDECLGEEVLLTEKVAREVNELLNKASDTYIYRIRQCKEVD
jgi:hypothetical protein